MEFVIYLGNNDTITVNDARLSKVYRLKKGQPTPVANMIDKDILASYKEKGKGSCCGKVARMTPIFTDVTYCQYRNLNLYDSRKFWEKQYGN